MRILRSRKALSPVVASIILIAVTVAVSIAVAAWMGALSFTFMGTESVAFVNYQWSGTSYFNMTIKNTGAADLTIQEIRIDNVVPNSTSLTTPYLLTKGSNVTISLTKVGGFVSGVNYEFIVITAKGNTFGPYTKQAP